MTYHLGTDSFLIGADSDRMLNVNTVRWWRHGQDTRMSMIHVALSSYHDTLGYTACGKRFPYDQTVEPPHHEMVNEDGTPDEEDRYCVSCLRAIGART